MRDTRVFRGFEIGSDHCLVKSYISLEKNREVHVRTKCTRVRIEKLKGKNVKLKFQDEIKLAFDRLNLGENRNVELEWEDYKSALGNIGRHILGTTVCKDNKRRTPWWSDAVKLEVKKKKELFKKWLQSKEKVDYQEYKKQRTNVTRLIQEAKKLSWEQFGENIEKLGQEGGKGFWKVVRTLRAGRKQEITNVKNGDGQIIVGKDKIMEDGKSILMIY